MGSNQPPGHEYDLNIKTVLRGLADQQISATVAMTITEIAAANNTSPMDIFEPLRQVVAKNRN